MWTETILADATMPAEPQSDGCSTGKNVFHCSIHFFWNNFISAFHAGSCTPTEPTETKAPQMSQPPPIPPCWTRPNLSLMSTTLVPPSANERTANTPPLNNQETLAAAVSSDTLSASFANLTLNSTLNSSTNVPTSVPWASPRVYATSPLKSPTKKLRFYSVTIGRCTGVFTNW